MTRIGIRADANETVATGHVMRCIAVAEELKRMGENPVFISADDLPRSLIEQRGYEFVSLQSDWKDMEKEIDQLQVVIGQYHIGRLLVDSYYVTKLYFEKLHTLTKIMYIDDFGKEIYDVDSVVCYANYYKELLLEERYPSKVKLLLGTDYTPLRNTFSNLPSKKISVRVKNLIVLSGGTDPFDFLCSFSGRIAESSLYKTLETVNVICGKYYMKYGELIREFSGNSKLHFYKAVEHIEDYMFSADIAITAAGVTSYELCAAGVPSITYIMAENQKKNAESFHEDGVMEYAGDLRCDFVLDRVMELLSGKFQDLLERKKASEIMRKKVDGKGAKRVAEEICRLEHSEV